MAFFFIAVARDGRPLLCHGICKKQRSDVAVRSCIYVMPGGLHNHIAKDYESAFTAS